MNGTEPHCGGCACGAVRFITRGAPRRAGLCHCMTCRKAHASAFNPFVVFGRDQVEIVGDTRTWRSSPDYQRAFCLVCGSRVWAGSDSNEIEISLGSFDTPGELAPQYESWVVRREPWQPALPVPQFQKDRPAETSALDAAAGLKGAEDQPRAQRPMTPLAAGETVATSSRVKRTRP